MKKLVPCIAFLAIIFFTFSVTGFAAEEKIDVKPTLLELQKFTLEQNEYLARQLESMMAILGQAGTYNQVAGIKKAILILLEDSKRNIALAGEVLKKDKLDERDITTFIDRMTLPLATISIVSQTYGIILSKEKKKIDKILEKFRKDKDNRSA